MKLADVQGFNSIDEIRNAYSIPTSSNLTKFSTITVPSGTKMYTGTANSLYGFNGEGLQFFINGTVENNWISKTENISNFFN